MKKVLAALAALVAAAIVWVLLSGREIRAPFADAFPSGAIGYAAVADGGSLVREIERSNGWKALAAGGARGAGLDALAAMLGEDAAAAFYGGRSPFGAAALAAVKGAETRGALRELVVSRLGGAPAGSHEGYDLYSFGIRQAPGLHGVYAAGADTAFAAVASRDPAGLVKAAIDLRAGKTKAPALCGDRAFVSGIGSRPGGKGTLLACAWMEEEALATLEKARALVVRRVGKDSPLAAQALAAAQEDLPVVSAGGYLYRDRGVRGMVRTRFSPSRLTKAQGALLPAAAGELGALRLAPKGTIAVNAVRIGDAKEAWKALASSPNPAAAAAAGWVKEYGIDFDAEIAPWLGGEAAVQLSDVQAGGLFPIPRAELVVAVKDRRLAERTVMRVMEAAAGGAARGGQQPWAFLRPEITRAEHRGVSVTSLSYPVPGLSPSFCFVGDLLVAGLDDASVREIIDTAGGARPSLLADPVFAEMRAGMPRRMSRCAWIDGEGALRAAEAVANWVVAVKKLSRSVSDEPPPEEETQIEEELPRLFAAARVFRAAMTGTVRERDTVDRYFAVRMGDIPAAQAP